MADGNEKKKGGKKNYAEMSIKELETEKEKWNKTRKEADNKLEMINGKMINGILLAKREEAKKDKEIEELKAQLKQAQANKTQQTMQPRI